MDILIVTATEFEISDLTCKLKFKSALMPHYKLYEFNSHNVYILITGVGMLNTTYYLSRLLATNTFDCAYNFGIAGAYNEAFKIGEIVNVTNDMVIELGTKVGASIIPFSISSPKLLLSNYCICNTNEALFPLNSVYTVAGITVNSVNTSVDFLKNVKTPHQIDVESMEGAAFMMCCKENNLTYFQVRAVSNYIKPKNESAWDIKTALYELNDLALEILKHLT